MSLLGCVIAVVVLWVLWCPEEVGQLGARIVKGYRAKLEE